MKVFIMLVGLPASGKSTALKTLMELEKNIFIISSDNFIQDIADKLEITYDRAFPVLVKPAEKLMKYDLMNAIDNHQRIIVWDQTNTTPKIRAGKLSKIPDTYKKIAWYFPKPDDDEWRRRLSNRPGKTIPDFILTQMSENIVKPTTDEGFDMVFDDIDIYNYLGLI